jgi:CheY-like chemotaxis protein
LRSGTPNTAPKFTSTRITNRATPEQYRSFLLCSYRGYGVQQQLVDQIVRSPAANSFGGLAQPLSQSAHMEGWREKPDQENQGFQYGLVHALRREMIGTVHHDSAESVQWRPRRDVKRKKRRPIPVRVVVAGNNASVRQELKTLLEQRDFIVAGEAEDGADAVRVVRNIRPRIAIMDLSMRVLEGIDAAVEIRRDPGVPVVLMTADPDESYALRALRSGVAGYVLKSKAPSCLFLAIREALRGNLYLSPGISSGRAGEGSEIAGMLGIRDRNGRSLKQPGPPV